MPIDSPSPETLGSDADRVAAIFANQTRWLLRHAAGITSTDADPARSWSGDGLTAARTGATGVLIADPDHRPDAATIDRGIAFLRASGSGDVLIWSASDDPKLELHFLSRGCIDSFRPRWMWRDLPDAALLAPKESPDGVTIHIATAADRDVIAAATAVPYVAPDQIQTTIDLASQPEDARQVWLLTAREQHADGTGRVVGLAAVNFSVARGQPVAALFNLGVDPDHRGRGIGTALTAAACKLATGKGATGIGLNATADGERIYRAVGFVDCGSGQTWYLKKERLRKPPAEREITWAERLGRGETADLPVPAPGLEMPNAETPLAFAARFGQAGAARWLIAHGIEPEIVPLWSLGMRDEARALMSDVRYVNAHRRPAQTTPLHEAIHWGDEELARELIEAAADLTARDAQYHSTPLGWANAIGRPEIAALIVQAGGKR